MTEHEAPTDAPRRIVATSDWHGELPVDLPEGDILVIAGDLLPVWDHDPAFQARWTRERLIPYLAPLPFKNIIFIGGNHDFYFMEADEWIALLPPNVHYLRDESAEIGGIRFHGSPWSNRFGDWAFMLSENDLADKWALISDETEVLIVHGPPFGACDLTGRWGNENVGSKTLRQRLVDLRIPLVITGHIHEGYGSDQIGETSVENVSLMDVDYRPVNPPRVLTLEFADA